MTTEFAVQAVGRLAFAAERSPAPDRVSDHFRTALDMWRSELVVGRA